MNWYVCEVRIKIWKRTSSWQFKVNNLSRLNSDSAKPGKFLTLTFAITGRNALSNWTEAQDLEQGNTLLNWANQANWRPGRFCVVSNYVEGCVDSYISG